MGIFGDFVDGIRGVIGTAQDVLNFGQDASGYDYEKSLENSLAVQEAQFGYNKQLQENAQAFNAEQAKLSRQFQEQMAKKQFNYDSVLNSAARDAYLKRMAGLNPAEASGSYGGSVTTPTVAQASSSPSSVGSSSAPVAQGFPGNSSYSLSEKLASEEKLKAEAENQRLRNITQLERDRAEINEREASAYKAWKDGNISEEMWKIRHEEAVRAKDRIDAQIEEIRSKTSYYSETAKVQDRLAGAKEKEAAAAETQASAAVQNAETNKEKLQIDRFNANSKRMLAVVAQDDYKLREKLNPVLVELNTQLAEKYRQDGRLTARDVENYYDKLNSRLDLQRAITEQAKKQAEKTGKDVEWYEFKMFTDVGIRLAQTVADFLPIKKAVSAAADAVRSNGGKSAKKAADKIEDDYEKIQREAFENPELRPHKDRPWEWEGGVDTDKVFEDWLESTGPAPGR